MSKGKVLVTGGTGYIGSHTVVELANAGYEPIIIDNLSNSERSVIDGIAEITGTVPPFEELDLCDLGKLDHFFQQNNGIHSIIHFAAHKAVGESVENSLKYYKNNLEGLINLLLCMKKFNINNIVFSSSCTVYGQPDVLPVTELAAIKPANSPYGNTKQISEEIIRDAIASYGSINAIALRYFNPIGAHPSALIGELPLGVPNNLVPFITQTAIGKRQILRVFGDDYNTPDGSCIRDYINVVDLASAHVIAIDRLHQGLQKKKLEIFNLGTGKGVSVLEIISVFEEATNVSLPYEIVDRRAGDVEQVWADTQFANDELGWHAEKTLEETLLSAWMWEQKIAEKETKTV